MDGPLAESPAEEVGILAGQRLVEIGVLPHVCVHRKLQGSYFSPYGFVLSSICLHHTNYWT